jgi:hypothetical protein
MASPDKRDIVTLHLKTERAIRDQLLGALRSRGTTMQQFFDTLMRMLVEHPEYIDQIEHWDDDDEEPVLNAKYALA